MIFTDNAAPSQITPGVVQTIGARRVQVTTSKGTIVARCDKEILDKLAVGHSVVVAFLGDDQTMGYVMSSSPDPFDTREKGFFTV